MIFSNLISKEYEIHRELAEGPRAGGHHSQVGGTGHHNSEEAGGAELEGHVRSWYVQAQLIFSHLSSYRCDQAQFPLSRMPHSSIQS